MRSDHRLGNLLGLTADIVAAHLSHSQVTNEALPSLIQLVYLNLSTVGESETGPTITPTPAVPVKKSVFPDFIFCLEDGKKLNLLVL
ncbi:MAG: MucR family transcriptional regulator [Janthinobacterium lividum]